MTAAIDPTSRDGYGWRMTDSERLDTRLDRVVRKRGLPQPFSAVAAETQITKHLSGPIDPKRADRLLAEAEQRIQREWLDRKAEILLSRLPARYRDADYIANRGGMQAKQWTENYRSGDRSGLVILGTVGTGKTWLAASIARDLMINGKPVPVTFITVADMLAELRTARPGLDVDMAQFMLAPVLVLDDLGQENTTDWTAEQLYRIAHARYHEGRPTIVTSNLTGDEIKARYESRTVQRLFGGSKKIMLVGESRRELPF